MGDVGGFGGGFDFNERGFAVFVSSEVPKAMFSRMVSLKRNVSCGTKPIWRRRDREGNGGWGVHR